jgi:hypothetical protein
MPAVTLELTPMEHATLVSLAALGVAIMQNDAERGQEHIAILSQPGVEESAKTVIRALVQSLAIEAPDGPAH